jgi:hypothetical protein
MGKIKDVVKKAPLMPLWQKELDLASSLNPFKQPETPELPDLPAPTLMEDTAAIEKTRRRAIGAATQRSGVASTNLSQPNSRTLLGGG